MTTTASSNALDAAADAVEAAVKSAYDAADTISDVALRRRIRDLLRSAHLHQVSSKRQLHTERVAASTELAMLTQAVRDDLTTREAHEALVDQKFHTFHFYQAESHAKASAESRQHSASSAQQRARASVQSMETSLASMIPRATRATK